MIKTTNSQTKAVTETYVGRVLEVKTFTESRNMSDTLDYSDWQAVKCTSALVWLGTRGKGHWADKEDRDLEFFEQFQWIDVSNHFAWRGCDFKEATRDAGMDIIGSDPIMLVNYIAWQSHQKALAAEADAKRVAQLAADEARKQELERNRPVVGKKMVVVKGRKVPRGHQGTVAYIHDNGGILLKDDAVWQDRKAPGVWVNAGNLAAR
jgi:hypothetical protein